MRLTCPHKTLATAFSTVASVIPSKPPKPILGNVKIESDGSLVTLLATDLEVGIRYELTTAQSDPGSLLLPKQKMQEILRECSGDITIDSDGPYTVITYGRSKFKIPTESPDEFPEVAKFDAANYYSMAKDSARKLIERTVYACDTQSAKFALGGILMLMSSDRAEFVSTDSHCMAISLQPSGMVGTPEKPDRPVLPSRAATLVLSSLNGSGPVDIDVRKSHAMFRHECVTIFARLVQGMFPRHESVIPKNNRNVARVVAGPFLSAVRQSMIVTSKETAGVAFRFNDGELSITGDSESGKSEVELPIDYQDEDISTKFNPQLLADFLKSVESDSSVSVEMSDGDSALLFTSGDEYKYLVMPMRE